MPDSVKRWVRGRMVAVGSIIARTGLSANALTLIGLLLNVGAAAIVAAGWFVEGGIAFLIASAFDMLDGAVARATNTTSRFGAFLDSVVDRYNEAAMFVALLVVFAQRGQTDLVLATALALVGSILVSYARARAEGLSVDCEVGLLQRPERVIIIGAGLIFYGFLLAPVLWGLALITNVTVVQRALHVRRELDPSRSP